MCWAYSRGILQVFCFGVVGVSAQLERRHFVIIEVRKFCRGHLALHAILLDGIFATDDGSPAFHPLLHLDDSDLADLPQVIRVRPVNFLERGVIDSRQELSLLDDDFAERERALALLAAAAVSGLLPARPKLRQHQPITLCGNPGVDVTAPLSVNEMGFSLRTAITSSVEG